MPSGLILQPSYRIRSGRPVVQLYGRLASGEPFLVEDDRYRPYFFVPARSVAALPAGVAERAAPSPLTSLSGEPLARVEVSVPGDVPPLRDALARQGVPVFEGDVRFAYRYLIDHGLRGSVEIEGASETLAAGLVRFRNPGLTPGRGRVPLRVLSLDLETTPDASQVFSVALATPDHDEVHLLAERPVAGAEVHGDEKSLLATATRRLIELDPDVLTGWNVVDFDLQVWQRRARALGIRDGLGRVDGEIRFQQDLGFGRQSRAEVPGRMVVDGIPLVRDALRLEDYRLETVARAVLGRGKLIDHQAPDPAQEIQRLHREDPEALVAYNREDARLVLDILDHEGLLDLTVERSLLTGMQLDRVGASIASFDLVYLPELRQRGFAAPSVSSERPSTPVQGGAVLASRPGIFEQVAVFDFKSLYPSLIRTFGLDPLAHARAGENAIVAPNGAAFAREGAILPEVIERFMARRAEARARGDRHADQAIKIMMNALFGVLAAPSCRFADPAIANAITGFGQQTLAWTRDAFESEGVEVLYGDTDSVFVQLQAADPDAAHSEAEKLRERVQSAIGARIREQYDVEPRLELELEKIFERFLMPRVRGGTSGSKKRYAGWTDARLELVGLESVRRDWPAVARRLQTGMLTRVFQDEEVLPFVRSLVERVLAGELDEELVYAKRVRKGALERYTATTPPHVQAARKAGGAAGPVVRYVITATGPEPVLPGRPFPEAVDRRHYLDRVLRPVADSILDLLDTSLDEALGAPKQLSLL
jgi:DNA polymerase-2